MTNARKDEGVLKKFFLGVATLLGAAPAVFAEAPAGPAGGGAMGGGLMGILPWVFIFGIFYLLLIRPQQKQAKEHKKMIEALKKGDRILMQGGLYGDVVSVKGKDLEVKIGEGMNVLMTKSSVSQLVTKEAS